MAALSAFCATRAAGATMRPGYWTVKLVDATLTALLRIV
jgi:hypothetical protein